MRDDWDDEPDDGFDDAADDDGSDTVECSNCGTAVYEDAEQCPACGEWIVHSTRPLSGRPMWFVVGGLIGVAAVIVTLVLAGF